MFETKGFNYFLLPPYSYDFSKVNRSDETVMIVNEKNSIVLRELTSESESRSSEKEQDAIKKASKDEFNFKDKILIIKELLKYMVPLFIVYYSEYLINQGLFELLYFKENSIGLDHAHQYRWYNVIFRFGVFIARSSFRFFQIGCISCFPLAQLANLFILLSQVIFGYMPVIWIVFVVVLFEGLVGGSAYVNILNRVSNDMPDNSKEFSIAITTIAGK